MNHVQSKTIGQLAQAIDAAMDPTYNHPKSELAQLISNIQDLHMAYSHATAIDDGDGNKETNTDPQVMANNDMLSTFAAALEHTLERRTG